MPTPNQTPEQASRVKIDAKLAEAGWIVQSVKTIDFGAGPEVVVREYQTDVGPANYIVFIDRKPVGVAQVAGQISSLASFVAHECHSSRSL